MGIASNPSATIPITLEASPEVSTIKWVTRDMPKNWSLFGGIGLWSILWFPATVGLTIAAANGMLPVPVSAVFLPIFWGGLMAALASYLRLGGTERISVANEYLEVGFEGLLRSRTVRYPRTAVRSVTLEHYDEESVRTLNLWSQGVHRFSGRTLLAYPLSDKAKEAIYEKLASTFATRGWDLVLRTDMKAPMPTV